MKKHPARSHDSKMASGTESVPILHNEKKSRTPIAGGKAEYFHDSGENGPTATVPNGVKEDRRKPGTPNHGPVPHPEKEKTHGFADYKRARGRDYNLEPVDSTDHAKNRTDLVPTNKRSGAGDDHRYISNTSSFGGKPWKK